MNTFMNSSARSESTLWVQNPIDGTSGIMVRARHAVFSGASPFQKIEVIDTYSFGKMLLLAGTVVLTEKDEHIYSEMIVHPVMLMHADPARVCIIGGGDGGCLREVLKHDCVRSVQVVEIDELVTSTVKASFPALAGSFSDPRVRVITDDGCAYLEKTGDIFDVIVVDSYDPGGPVQSLETANFHKLVRDHLAPEGLAVFQTDSPLLRPEVLRTTAAHVSSCFAEYRPYLCVIPSFPDGICGFLACSAQEGRLLACSRERQRAIAGSCRYYNDDIHTGAFLLPRHIKRILDTNAKRMH